MQETFDKVWAHAQNMTVPASNHKGLCMYRSPNGPCLIGILVSDEEAQAADWKCLSAFSAVGRGFFKELKLNASFYQSIQSAHDSNILFDDKLSLDKEAMLHGLRLIAEEYGLEVK